MVGHEDGVLKLAILRASKRVAGNRDSNFVHVEGQSSDRGAQGNPLAYREIKRPYFVAPAALRTDGHDVDSRAACPNEGAPVGRDLVILRNEDPHVSIGYDTMRWAATQPST